MSGSSIFTGEMAVISNSIFAQLSSADMTCSSIIETFLLSYSEYHLLREFKLVIYLFYIFYKSIYEYLCYIIVFVFSRVRYRILRVYAVLEAFYIITKRARGVLLILFSIR